MHKKFKFSHSLLGTILALIIEALIVTLAPTVGVAAILVIATVVAAGNLYVATEVVEEVRNIRHMTTLLCAVIAEFVIFFALQYHLLLKLVPQSFLTLGQDPISLALNSVMVFVFNPLYLPADMAGRALLLINTLAALGLVLFVLQNIWQLRRSGDGR